MKNTNETVKAFYTYFNMLVDTISEQKKERAISFVKTCEAKNLPLSVMYEGIKAIVK